MKPFWQSKTLGLNVLMIGALVLQELLVGDVIPLQYQAAGLAVLNALLRFLTTQPVTVPGVTSGPTPEVPTS